MSESIMDIYKEMREVFPKKELAYMDYTENTGADRDFRERMWDEFTSLRDYWNSLLDKWEIFTKKERDNCEKEWKLKKGE